MPRAVMFERLGGPEVLQLVDEPTREPGPGEVRIRVAAIGLNRAEIMFREGTYLARPELPSRIGYEAAGVVTAVGAGVDEWRVGDRVGTLPTLAMSSHGVWAEEAVVPARALAATPPNLSDAEGAAIWIAYGTAWGGVLEAGGLRAGDAALITAASSSTGVAAIQLAKRAGAAAIATTRTAAKRAALVELGADHVIVTDDEDLVGRVEEITAGAGAKVVFDPVAGPGIEALCEAAAPGGTVVIYGSLAAGTTPFPFRQALMKGLSVRGYTIFETLTDPARWARADADLRTGFTDRSLTPAIAERFPFDRIADAQRFMASNRQIGKIVVEVG